MTNAPALGNLGRQAWAGGVFQTRRASLVFASTVFVVTAVQVLAPPVTALVEGHAEWPLALPPAWALLLLLVGCAAQAATLLLASRWPRTSVFTASAVYLLLLIALAVPNWLVGTYLVVALAHFLLSTRVSVASAVTCLLANSVFAMGGLTIWILAIGTDPGFALGFVSAEVVRFFAPALGATALGAWWAAQVRRVTLAREQAELARQEHDLRVAEARERERARIGQELHDVAGQHLAGLITLADAAVSLAPQRPLDALQLVEDVRNEGRFAAASLAGALSDLRAESTASVEATRDLRRSGELVDYWARRGMAVRLETEGAYTDLPAVVSTSVYRALQEALTNAAKHAPGAEVHAYLSVRPDRLTMVVTNGASALTTVRLPGLDLGWGLNGMRERVELLRGTLSALPTVDGGWQVRLTIPLDIPTDS